MKKQFGIRMSFEVTSMIESFAEAHGMKPTAAAEYFVKLGADSLVKNEQMDARLDRLEEQLKAMHFANYRNLSYLTLLSPGDKEKFEKAKAVAEKNVSEIFGDVHGQ